MGKRFISLDTFNGDRLLLVFNQVNFAKTSWLIWISTNVKGTLLIFGRGKIENCCWGFVKAELKLDSHDFAVLCRLDGMNQKFLTVILTLLKGVILQKFSFKFLNKLGATMQVYCLFKDFIWLGNFFARPKVLNILSKVTRWCLVILWTNNGNDLVVLLFI